MVLEHVPQGAGLLVVARAVLDSDRFGRRDLDMIDVFSIPDRLIDRVGEAEHEDILDGLLAQIMIDAVDLFLAEDAAEGLIQLLRGRPAPSVRPETRVFPP